MTLKIRIPRPFFPSSGRGLTALATASAPARATFHAMLTDCMDEWVVDRSPVAALPQAPRTSREIVTQTPEAINSVARPASPASAKSSWQPSHSRASSLARAWSWLHSKYALSATKRLRVSETVSLGEKRFVALVCVEGREFLIGGGSAGVSLLSALGTTPSAAGEQRASKNATEDSE
jgi:hypothetical protein